MTVDDLTAFLGLRRYGTGRSSGGLVIFTRAQAEALYGGNVPPGVLVLIEPPARWPLSEPWPPKVLLPPGPCLRCIAGAR